MIAFSELPPLLTNQADGEENIFERQRREDDTRYLIWQRLHVAVNPSSRVINLSLKFEML